MQSTGRTRWAAVPPGARLWAGGGGLAGGLTNPGGPSTGAPGPDNFIIAFVDAMTGQVKTTAAGMSHLLPPLPVIRG